MDTIASPAEPGRGSSLRGLPWITVLMPVYNGEPYVTQAIDSILAQTHEAFEFLIVDDGSTDGTPAVLERYAREDPRVRVVRQVNIGQPATLNRGLELARCEWVAIMDHDDVCLPTRLAKQLEMLHRVPEARLIGTWAQEISADGTVMGLRCTGPTTAMEFRALDAAGQRVPLTHPSVLMHRQTVLSLGGYDAAFGPSADTELWTRVARRHPIVVVPEVLLRYRIHRQSMSFRQMFEQREMLRWSLDRDEARRRNRAVKTLAEFRARRRPWHLRRWREGRQDLFWYFRSHCLLASAAGRRARAMALAVCAAAVAPQNAFRLGWRRLSEKLAKGPAPREVDAAETAPLSSSPESIQ